MSLAQYRKRFSRLRTYKDRKKWSAITAFQAPHKPFLLLSIMDLIVQGSITENFIEPSFELVETFNGYWNSIMPLGSKTSMAYPFPRLKTDGFWHLIPNPGYKKQINITLNKRKQNQERSYLFQHRKPGPLGQVRVQWLCHLYDSMLLNDQVVPTTYDQGVTNESISKINTNYLALPISYCLGA